VETQSKTAEVEPKVKELTAVKSGQPVNLHPKFLKELAHVIKSPEAMIFNECMKPRAILYN